MGNFYVNFSVKVSDQRRVGDILHAAGRVALVTPLQDGYVVVYDEEADSQATEPILQTGALLSRETQSPVLAVLNHDDDILCYWLFERGRLTDSFNSHPDYFEEGEAPTEQGGDVERLCAALGADAEPSEVNAVLRGSYAFAVEKHQELAQLLRLPSSSVGFGYGYAASGELEDELGTGELIDTK